MPVRFFSDHAATGFHVVDAFFYRGKILLTLKGLHGSSRPLLLPFHLNTQFAQLVLVHR